MTTTGRKEPEQHKQSAGNRLDNLRKKEQTARMRQRNLQTNITLEQETAESKGIRKLDGDERSKLLERDQKM